MGTGDWTNSDKDPNNAPRAVPTGEWECIEWMHAGATNETRFYWDAVEHASLYTSATKHGGNTNPYKLRNSTAFGSVGRNTNEHRDLRDGIDEIAIDSARIGCVL